MTATTSGPAVASDVGIVGAGVVGLAAALALRDRGVGVTVYERGTPGAGQSGGRSRILRHAHRDPRLVDLVRASRRTYADWGARFGRDLLGTNGVVMFGGRAAERQASLERAGVPVEVLSGAHVRERLPALAGSVDRVVLDPTAGTIRAREVVATLLAALERPVVHDDVLAVHRARGGTVRVRCGGRVGEHDAVVVCAGVGTPALARSLGFDLPVRTAAHVRVTFPLAAGTSAPGRAAPAWPSFLDGGGDGEVGAYGSPEPDAYDVGLSLHVAAGGEPSIRHPGRLDDAVERTVAYVRRTFPGLVPEPLALRHCWVTTLPWDADAIAAWQRDGITLLAGNNLFKHAPAIADLLADAVVAGRLGGALDAGARLGAPEPDTAAPWR